MEHCAQQYGGHEEPREQGHTSAALPKKPTCLGPAPLFVRSITESHSAPAALVVKPSGRAVRSQRSWPPHALLPLISALFVSSCRLEGRGTSSWKSPRASAKRGVLPGGCLLLPFYFANGTCKATAEAGLSKHRTSHKTLTVVKYVLFPPSKILLLLLWPYWSKQKFILLVKNSTYQKRWFCILRKWLPLKIRTTYKTSFIFPCTSKV